MRDYCEANTGRGRDVVMQGEVSDDVDLERRLRSEIKHSLASPIRGMSILTDLLAESLNSDAPDMHEVRQISEQLTTLTGEATDRLQNFSSSEAV